MPLVTFIPLGLEVEAQTGESILDVALRSGVALEHNCGGVCACTTCHVIVRQGDTELSDIEDDENDRLSQAEGLTLHSRLGCQALVLGDKDIEIEVPAHVGYVMETG
ncbi:MAG: 2Fe-2S iron-sulfur cluster-binding protein [Candidatus Latescibacteria bacterium]|jgi:2Fe-2S ferredoxin|nr:2Fe-2S iron-sulfur cluster-binding protein [Candidatus Latescibacterota bacterium]